MKPLYKIIIITVAILLTALLVYFIWKGFSEPTEPEVDPFSTSSLPLVPVAPPIKEFPEEIKGEAGTILRRISDKPIFDYFVNVSGKTISLTKTGVVLETKFGEDTTLSQEPIEALNRLIPNSDGTKALVSNGSPFSPSWKIFDSMDSTWRPLPAEILNAAWGSKTNEIIAIAEIGTERSLVLFDYTKTPVSYTVIQKSFRLNDVSFLLLNSSTLFVFEKPSFYVEGRAWTLDLKTYKLSTILEGQRGMLFNWDPAFKTLFSFSGPNQFSILDEKFSLRIPSIYTTFPTKCASFASSSAYCFIPKELATAERPLTLPDDYIMKRFYTNDVLYLISEDVGSEPVVLGDLSTFPVIDATHTSFVDGKLFFINRYDSYLYELSLPK